jgi:hypothetical protein
MIDLKLQTVTRMALPDACDFDLFTFGNGKDCTDHGHPGPTVLIQARHSVVRFGILVGDPADRALQRCGLVLLFGQGKSSARYPT